MARDISSAIETQTQAEGIRLAHLLKIEDLGENNTDLRVTNHVKNLTYDSEIYIAGGNLLSIGEVAESGELEYTNLNVILSNVTDLTRNLFKYTDPNNINNPASIFLVFLNSSEQIVDTYEYFKGTVSGVSLEHGKGATNVNLEIASHWKNWDIKKGRKYTQESQSDKFSGDLGLSFAHQTTENVRWNR